MQYLLARNFFFKNKLEWGKTCNFFKVKLDLKITTIINLNECQQKTFRDIIQILLIKARRNKLLKSLWEEGRTGEKLKWNCILTFFNFKLQIRWCQRPPVWSQQFQRKLYSCYHKSTHLIFSNSISFSRYPQKGSNKSSLRISSYLEQTIDTDNPLPFITWTDS